MFPNWTPQQLELMRQGIAWSMAHPGVAAIPEFQQCCNFGADECDGRAEANGWCSGCWDKIDPKR